MYHILEIPELLEAIFVFLSRKDLYRSCARVNHQWNAVSKHIIQKKRKAEFINIPSICDNILLHVYNDFCNNDEFNKYLDVSKLWGYKLNYLYIKDFHLNTLHDHDRFLNSARNIKRKLLLRSKKWLIRHMNVNTLQCLKHDREFNRYYQDILSQYDIRGEFLRLSRVCQSYDYLTNTQDEFRRMSRAFRSINL